MSGIAAIVSFRLGGTDGVSREAAKWEDALRALGWRVVTVAGQGPVDRCLPGLAIDAPMRAGVQADEVAAALDDADVVVVENLCSLPLNPWALAVVAGVLEGRPAVLRHHDLPWQRARFADWPEPPPDDPAWAHVTINRMSERELADRGIRATTLYNAFDVHVPLLAKHDARAALGLDDNRRVVLQPTRAIARKNVPAGLRLAEELDAVFWLTGPAEEGYGPELASLLDGATVPVVHRPIADMAVAYGACDVVAFPSTFEGFGNPVIEAAIHRRPLAVAWYPVLDELREFGFEWLPVDSPEAVREWLEVDDVAGLDHNQRVARQHFSLAALPERLGTLFEAQGWRP